MSRKILVIAIFMLMATPIIVSSDKTNTLSNDGNVPTWSVGNNWVYRLRYDGTIGDVLSFNWIFDNIVFSVNSDEGSIYRTNVNGNVEGELSLSGSQIIKGTLKDTTVSGTADFQKSNIGINELDIRIEGKISIAGIPIKSFTLDLDLTFSPAYNPIIFPISVGKKWRIPTADVSGKADISLLDNPIYIDELVGGDNAECTGMESKSVDAGTFNAYKIVSDSDVTEFYYSEEAGNIIQAYGAEDGIIDYVLKSTSYGGEPGAPNKPSRPTGPGTGVPDTEYSYSSVTIDPESDQIYYQFDWGDGQQTGWLGPYNSGSSVSASHTWSRKATFSVKVKAKDTSENESPWSEPLSVKIPRSKFIIMDHLLKLFEKFPLLQEMINRL